MKTLFACCCAVLLLAGCGNKGPLVLPQKPVPVDADGLAPAEENPPAPDAPLPEPVPEEPLDDGRR